MSKEESSILNADPVVLYGKVSESDGKAYPLYIQSGYAIAAGLVSKQTAWTKTGYNGDVDSAAAEDLWVNGGAFSFAPSASTMQIVSASSDDDDGGTGVNKVIVTYLDANYVESTEIVTLNGTTSVSTTAVIYRVNNFRAYTCGTGGKAAGNINIQTAALTISTIGIGASRARNAAYTVPSATTLYINQARFSSIGTTNGKDAIFTARCNYDDKRGAKIDFFMPFIEVGVMDGAIDLPFCIPVKIPQTVDIKIAAAAGNNDAICTSVLRGWLET